MSKQIGDCTGVGAGECAKEPRGLLFTLPAWKAALLGPFVDFLGLAAMVPLIPFFVADAGASDIWVGAILSAQYFGVCFGSLFWGRVADLVGVRQTYLLLLVLDVVCFTASAFMTSVVGLLVVRAMAGFCAIMPLGSAWIAATAPPERMMQAFTYLVVSVLLGFILGSALGGTAGQLKTGIGIGDGGWFSALMCSALLCAIVFFIILFGTVSPPKVSGASKERKGIMGVMQPMLNMKYFASCITAFGGANEGGMMLVITSAVLAYDAPSGYAYSSSLMGIVWVVLASVIMVSSVCLSAWLGSRSHPLQRIVLLGAACTAILSGMTLLGFSLDAQGLWLHGDKVYLALKVSLFFFQCCVGPTAMAIAAGVAATAPENSATIMGVQQAFLSLGQAVGPMLGSLLLKVGFSAPFAYVAAFEAAALALNAFVYRRAMRAGEFDGRGICDLRLLPTPEVESVVEPTEASEPVALPALLGASEESKPADFVQESV